MVKTKPSSVSKQGVSYLTASFNNSEVQKPNATARRSGAAMSSYFLEIAFESDSFFTARYGGSFTATQRIFDILNLVDGIYEAELGMDIIVTYGIARQNGGDPASYPLPLKDGTAYNGGLALLEAFRDEWNANFTSVRRDTAHLFTSRYRAEPGRGLAYVGVVCTTPSFSYGFTHTTEITSAITIEIDTVAHELGHNLGTDAGHNVDNTQEYCRNRNSTTGYQIPTPFFCQFNRSQIFAHIFSAPGHVQLDCLYAPPSF